MPVSRIASDLGLAAASAVAAGAAVAVPCGIAVERLVLDGSAPEDEPLAFCGGGTLDLGAGVAPTVCVGDQDGVQRIRDGGGIGGLEARQEAAVVPLTATPPPALAALGGPALGFGRRR